MRIVVRMLGGLGNQMFQYAYARHLMALYPDLKLSLDLREYDRYKVRDFELNSMKLNCSIDIYQENNSIYYDISRNFFYIYQFIYRKIHKRPLGLGSVFLSSHRLIYSGIDALKEPNLKEGTSYLYGYFQDISIVETNRDQLLSEFSYKYNLSKKAKLYLNEINDAKTSIGVSIRCGKDYEESGWPICKIEYYKKGLEILIDKNPNNKIFIFADDINKVKKQFGFKNDVIYIENCSAIESLELLKRCDDFIISNSSFSWWGAYLSENPNKLVIMPEKWFTGLKTKDTALLFSSNTIILNN